MGLTGRHLGLTKRGIRQEAADSERVWEAAADRSLLTVDLSQPREVRGGITQGTAERGVKEAAARRTAVSRSYVD